MASIKILLITNLILITLLISQNLTEVFGKGMIRFKMKERGGKRGSGSGGGRVELGEEVGGIAAGENKENLANSYGYSSECINVLN